MLILSSMLKVGGEKMKVLLGISILLFVIIGIIFFLSACTISSKIFEREEKHETTW
jgi:nitrogen fixation-related uncharacterized protein